jgi:tetratricopeptide (TPR) repeat protein
MVIGSGEAIAATPVLQPSVPPPAELPADVADFTGRQAELDQLRRRVAAATGSAVVVTAVDGMGGIGKSALAIHLAHQLVPRFPAAQLYVNLRGAEPPSERPAPAVVLEQFLRALGVAAEDVPSDSEMAARLFRSLLAGRRALIVLDNAADAAQVRPLLPGSGTCAVLVTSRVRLNLEGAVSLSLGVLAEAEAVQLLARLAGPEHVVTDSQAATTVVHQCGLLPLAVRIAGARLAARPAWTVADLAAQLADERSRLAGLEAGDLAVRASFGLSYHGLPPAQARTFRLLGLLDNPEAAAGVVAALTNTSPEAAGATLEELVDAQLLEQPVPGRYRFHDLLRLFAREQAEIEDSRRARTAALARAMDRYYLGTAEQAKSVLLSERRRGHRRRGGFADWAAALAWLEAERTNLVAAVEQAARLSDSQAGRWGPTTRAGRLADAFLVLLGFREHRGGLMSVAWRLANALKPFFSLSSYWADGQAVYQAALRATRRVGDRRAEGWMLNHLGRVHAEQGRFDQAIAYYEESLAVFRRRWSRYDKAAALNSLGGLYAEQGDLDQATTYYKQSLAICRRLLSRSARAIVLGNLGGVSAKQGDLDQATTYYKQSLTIFRQLRDGLEEAWTLRSLGEVSAEQGDLDQAITYNKQSLAICRKLRFRLEEAKALRSLGRVSAEQDDLDQATTYYKQSLAIYQETGDRRGEAKTLRRLGNTVKRAGDTEAAHTYWSAALAILDDLGAPEADQVRAQLEDNGEANDASSRNVHNDTTP